MRADRASDLHLTREHRQTAAIDAGGCAPSIRVLTERQADQATVERLRAEYLQRANLPALALVPVEESPRGLTPGAQAAIRAMVRHL